MSTKKNTAKAEKKEKLLSPAQARREIEALAKFLDDGDLTIKQFWDLKMAVLARMGAGNE